MRINSIPRRLVSYALAVCAIAISLLLLAGDATWGPYAPGRFSSRIDMVRAFKFGPAADVALSPDGRTVALRRSAAVELWDLASQTLLRRITGTIPHQSFLPGQPGSNTLLWSPDGRHLAIGSMGEVINTVQVVDTSTGQPYRSLTPPAPRSTLRSNSALPVTWSPDGRVLIVRTTGDLNPYGNMPVTYARVTYWNVDPRPGELKLLGPEESAAESLAVESLLFPGVIAWSPDSRAFVSYGRDGGLGCWDIYSGKSPYELADGRPGLANWSANGKTIAYVNAGTGSVRLSDCKTGPSGNTLFKPDADLSPGIISRTSVRGLAWSPDERTLATYATAGVGLSDRSGLLRDFISAGEIPSGWEYGGNGSRSGAEVQWSRDGKLLTTSEYFNSARVTRIWSVELGSLVETLVTTGSKQVLWSSYPDELLIVYDDMVETWRLFRRAT